MEYNFYSTPFLLNRKLYLIKETSPAKTLREIKSICQTLDISGPELENQFKYLKDVSSPQRRPFQMSLSASSLNSSYISHKPRRLMTNVGKSYLSTCEMNQNIKTRLNYENYAKRCFYLENKLEEKNAIIRDFENLCHKAFEKLGKLVEENSKLRVQMETYKTCSPLRNIPEKDQEINVLKKELKKIEKKQNECNKKLTDLNYNTNNSNIHCHHKNKDPYQWEEMRKMNEEINLLVRSNKNNELQSDIKFNDLKLQIQNLERELSLKSYQGDLLPQSKSYLDL